MAELNPAPFRDLMTRLYREPAAQGTLFDLPRRDWYVPAAGGPDISVRFHGVPAGNPAGPAAGPHTQMAQNLLLSYVAGARVLELKTVQINDRLNIPRPCIDSTNVSYNVEWSQELLLNDTLREYVAGMMLVHAFRHGAWEEAINGRSGGTKGSEAPRGLKLATRSSGNPFLGPSGEVLYDISLGYDLAGIRSDKVQRFLDGVRDMSEMIERLREEIPRSFPACELSYPTCLSTSVTLSTFHGCPAHEIERICEFVVGTRDLDVVVKMNPPMLGKERVEHLLHDVMGYTELAVSPKVYETGLGFTEAVEMCHRLTRFSAARGRRVGFKFSNTLEVANHRDFFTPDNEIMYLSGQPLYVLAMSLAEAFSRAVGPHVPITFSGGVDKFNFPVTVACGYVPVTTSADLLRVGGYARLPGYLHKLAEDIRRVEAATIDEYILKRFDQADEARRRAEAETDREDGTKGHRDGEETSQAPSASEWDTKRAATVRWAAWLNAPLAAAAAREEPRYTSPYNRKVPKRIGAHLDVFDCITCNKCIPACPNAANFTYPTPIVLFDCRDLLIDRSGTIREGESRRFEITESMQIACYADFCNECGNCDTFCPEYGGPYIRKPSFFGTVESWRAAAPRDGFVVQRTDAGGWIRGRIQEVEYHLAFDAAANRYRFGDDVVELVFSAADHTPLSAKRLDSQDGDHRVDMNIVHTLRHLYHGALDPSRINQVNATYAS